MGYWNYLWTIWCSDTAIALFPWRPFFSEILKCAPEQPVHFLFLYLEFCEDSVPFCIVAALAA